MVDTSVPRVLIDTDMKAHSVYPDARQFCLITSITESLSVWPQATVSCDSIAF